MSPTSATAATSAMSCGSTHATRPDPNGSTMRPRSISACCRSSTVVKNDGSSTVAATGDAASRRSIARWFPCRPPTTPGIGMLETLTMRATPAASAASIALVSNATWSRVGDDTRNTARTPCERRCERRRIPEIAEHHLRRRPRRATASGRRTNARTGTRSTVQHAHDPPTQIAGRTDDEHRHRASLACAAPSAHSPVKLPPCVSRDTDPSDVAVRRCAGGRSRSRRSEHRAARRSCSSRGAGSTRPSASSRPSKREGTTSIRAARRSPQPAVAP